MNKWMMLFLGLCGLATAAPTTNTPGTVQGPVVAGGTSAGRMTGTLDLRPSWGSQKGEVHTENYAQLGYLFNPSVQLSYRQEFNTNIYNPTGNQGLGLAAVEGYVITNVNDIWRSGNTSFSWEGRLNMPTNAVKRDAGMILAVRNYARLKHRIGQSVTLTLDEYPIFHIYNQAGFNNVANPWFENRVAFVVEYSPVPELKFSLPTYLYSVRTRDFAANAKGNDRWLHKVFIWPEVNYSLSPNMVLGVAYYSQNLFKDDLSDSAFGVGFETGITQMVLKARL